MVFSCNVGQSVCRWPLWKGRVRSFVPGEGSVASSDPSLVLLFLWPWAPKLFISTFLLSNCFLFIFSPISSLLLPFLGYSLLLINRDHQFLGWFTYVFPPPPHDHFKRSITSHRPLLHLFLISCCLRLIDFVLSQNAPVRQRELKASSLLSGTELGYIVWAMFHSCCTCFR